MSLQVEILLVSLSISLSAFLVLTRRSKSHFSSSNAYKTHYVPLQAIKTLLQAISSYFFCTKATVDVSAIQSSWSAIKATLGDSAPETVGRLVFENLFKEYPEMLTFFKNYGSTVEEVMSNKKFMWHAKERVFITFDKVVTQLEDLAEIDNVASWLAKAHNPKGVKAADYLKLGNAILLTLEQALGSGFTPELKANWNSVLVNVMKAIGSHTAE